MRRKSLAELKKKKVDLWKLTGRYKSPREKVVGEVRPLKRGDIKRINEVVDRLLKIGGDKIDTILLVGGGARHLRGTLPRKPGKKYYSDIDLRIIIKNPEKFLKKPKYWGRIRDKMDISKSYKKEKIDILISPGYEKGLSRDMLLGLKGFLQGEFIPIYNKEGARKLLEKIEKDLKKR